MPQNDRPVNIRRNIENYGDPYIPTASAHEVKICSKCNSVYHDKRWCMKEQVPPEILRKADKTHVLCPACQKIRDRMPGGVVHLSGVFLRDHKEEILNLIRNESGRAMAINPLERIMDIETVNSGLNVLTTNEKLAQRIGRALYKAYDGNVTYKWSEDTKLVRILWQRD